MVGVERTTETTHAFPPHALEQHKVIIHSEHIYSPFQFLTYTSTGLQNPVAF